MSPIKTDQLEEKKETTHKTEEPLKYEQNLQFSTEEFVKLEELFKRCVDATPELIYKWNEKIFQVCIDPVKSIG